MSADFECVHSTASTNVSTIFINLLIISEQIWHVHSTCGSSRKLLERSILLTYLVHSYWMINSYSFIHSYCIITVHSANEAYKKIWQITCRIVDEEDSSYHGMILKPIQQRLLLFSRFLVNQFSLCSDLG